MQAVNFQLSATRYLVVGEDELDLHNDFALVSVEFNALQQSVALSWRRREEESDSRSLPRLVSLRCEGVTAFSATLGDSSLPFGEALCLSSIGYYSTEVPEQFWIEEMPEDRWGWSFQFQSGGEFRVSGSKAYATAEP